MLSFDVEWLFTNVPLDRTIDIILKRIYDHKELETPITRCEMKEMLTLCTKNVHFTYNRKIFVQTDGVAMGSPLGPVFADIFMIELEKTLLPDIYIQYIKFWRRYIDDTISYNKIGSIKHILSLLNSFDENIQFTFESENKGTLPFLDVLLCRNGRELITTVYRKKTNNDIYLNWNAFAPVSWKRGTLRTLVQRAYLVCSTETYLKEELTYLEKVFFEKNNYPKYVINQVFTQVKEEHKSRNYNNNIKNSIAVSITLENKNEKRHSLTIPYQGEKGDYLIKSMKRNLKKILPNNVKPQITYTGRKLGSLFETKDQTIFEHKHDVIYHGKCPAENCVDDYIGEKARRVNERIVDHTGRDVNSHLLKHLIESGHKPLEAVHYKIIGTGYRKDTMKRKLSEALFIKELNPTLNKQEKSVPLKLFN